MTVGQGRLMSRMASSQPKQKIAPVAVLEALVDAHRIIMAVAIDQFDTARKRLAEADGGAA